jgi:hypothetical protein
MFALKALSHEGVESALAKAERYRLLNESAEAESICLDILEIEPENQQALICYLLALADRLAVDSKAFQGALSAASRLKGEYERTYYSGIVWERRAKAAHENKGRGTRHSVYEWMVRALEYFEKAEKLHPPGNDDTVLRWNTCVRFLASHPDVVPRSEEIPEPIVSE